MVAITSSAKSCLKDSSGTSQEICAMESEEAKDLTMPKLCSEVHIKDEPLDIEPSSTAAAVVGPSTISSKVARKRSVNFNLTIDFKKCDNEFPSVSKIQNNNCDAPPSEVDSRAASESSIADFSDIESLCIPTTPGGRAQVM